MIDVTEGRLALARGGVLDADFNAARLRESTLVSAVRPYIANPPWHTLTAQTETPPYRYVSVEGPAQVITDPIDALALATRYLGPELGQWYVEENPSDEHTAVVRITPEHWRTFDFGKALA